MSQKVINEIKLGFKDVLIQPKRSKLKSRSQVDLIRELKCPHGDFKWQGVPIIAANMDTTGTFEMARSFIKHKMIVAIHKHYTLEDWYEFFESLNEEDKKNMKNHVMVSSGTSMKDFEHLKNVIKKFDINFICIDIANGYSEHLSHFVKKARKEFPDKFIMAGNVVTIDMANQLIFDGASCVKIGIGPGSVCTTRKQTGVGYPQLSAILECSDVHGQNGLICGDGGITCPGDAAKAFGAGADFVMVGGLFAGHDESGGACIEINDKKYVEFYGMSSESAMDKHSGGVADYRSSEGKRVLLPYRGSIHNTVKDMLGGIRSTCTYVGADQLKKLSKCTTFIRVNEQLNEVYTKHND
jgi:GMP reductase